MSWTAENDTIKPIAALPLQAAGAGSIMEPQTEPETKPRTEPGLHRKTGLVLR